MRQNVSFQTSTATAVYALNSDFRTLLTWECCIHARVLEQRAPGAFRHYKLGPAKNTLTVSKPVSTLSRTRVLRKFPFLLILDVLLKVSTRVRLGVIEE